MSDVSHGKNGALFRFCILALLLCSCKIEPPIDGILLRGGGDYVPEREFLEQLLSQADFQDTWGINLIPADGVVGTEEKLIIDFEASWMPGDGILISRTWLVPMENPLAERTDTTLVACLDGTETLVPIGEIVPPYTGLLVDGLSVADENYPLVRHVSISIKEAETNARRSKKEKARLKEKIAALEMQLEEADRPLIQNTPSLVWISAAGDLMLGRRSGGILIDEGAAGVFGETAEYFKRADISIVNLEGAVSSRGEKVSKAFNFRFNPLTVPILKAAGINAVLLANNHVFDYGETAFLDTLDHLKYNGIAALGAGRNIDAASAPYILKAERLTIQVFGIASFPRERNGWDGASVAATEKKPGILFAGQDGLERLKKKLNREEGILKIVLFHGGEEWTWNPTAHTRSLYTGLAQCGADLIIGSHPHTTQGFEWVEGGLVFWSLGNFVFDSMDDTIGGEEGLLIKLGYAGKTLIYFEPVPVRLAGPRSGYGTAEQLRRFYARSRELQKEELP
jgi:poly-gamma-glutamate synthesis protein (capsule biosynthesis protein)